jgi:hypothetical protein
MFYFYFPTLGVLRHVQPLLMKGEEHKVSAKRPYSIVTCRSPAAAREARKLLRAVARNQGLALTIGKKKKSVPLQKKIARNQGLALTTLTIGNPKKKNLKSVP